MKWDCGRSWPEEYAAKRQWHSWFAWFPVRVGTHDCRWLELVERKGEYCSSWDYAFWSYEYRPLV